MVLQCLVYIEAKFLEKGESKTVCGKPYTLLVNSVTVPFDIRWHKFFLPQKMMENLCFPNKWDETGKRKVRI